MIAKLQSIPSPIVVLQIQYKSVAALFSIVMLCDLRAMEYKFVSTGSYKAWLRPFRIIYDFRSILSFKDLIKSAPINCGGYRKACLVTPLSTCSSVNFLLSTTTSINLGGKMPGTAEDASKIL